MKPLKRPVRRALLSVHVAVSVSWLGLSPGLLALGITAYATADASLTVAADRAMQAAGVPDSSLIAAPIVATSTYLLMTVISVLKPRGLTRRGRRMRASAYARPPGRESVRSRGTRVAGTR
ncbi:hypothetical protein EIZ62_16420 [Streptomyces ficellus]|uniref:DUF2269 domain-containing protein n=1 Tax=Streptomyces ficellus TaxID=1977088 RepID=A0A6I6F7H6_9ACTN|nr:hypothetical protein [Streptomyces ficellus]QGV79650.1 hypothetical protein EIZ62_16420 [Streptomyces ficellus]